MGDLNRRVGKLENVVLWLTGITFLVWIANRYYTGLSTLFSTLLIGLILFSLLLFLSVLALLLQKKTTN